MADAFDAFAGALRVRDALAACSCCEDDAETQERFETAEQLLAWVVETRAEMAAMRALETGVAKREPLTPAQRSARYRASKAVTKTVTARHESRHGAVTQSVTTPASEPPSRALPSDLSNAENISDSLNAQKEEKHAGMLSESVTSRVTKAVTDSVTAEDVSSEWHASLRDVAPTSLHATRSWLADYEIVAGACNALDEPQTAVVAVCRWFWQAPDGPVRSGRVRAAYAKPSHLAKHVSTDLLAAAAWWQTQQQEAAQ